MAVFCFYLVFVTIFFGKSRKNCKGLVKSQDLICRIGNKFYPSRIGMARMDTVDLSSGDEVYTPDVEEVEDDLLSLFF